MGDSHSSGNALANILVDHIFIDKDTTAAELMIIGIADTLESGNGLSADQREYVQKTQSIQKSRFSCSAELFQFRMNWSSLGIFILEFLMTSPIKVSNTAIQSHHLRL